MSKYQVTVPSSAAPEVQELATQFNAIFVRLVSDLKISRFTREKLPTDDSVRVAIVTDDTPASLNFWDGATWQKLLV